MGLDTRQPQRPGYAAKELGPAGDETALMFKGLGAAPFGVTQHSPTATALTSPVRCPPASLFYHRVCVMPPCMLQSQK